MTELNIGGFVSYSTCDWPGELVATVFCQGCAWRCPYCHNPGLLSPCAETPLYWPALRSFLSRRRGLLDGVVFSGCEPTLQEALPQAIDDVRQMGFRVGLHTSGMAPERFALLLSKLDWVGFDIKAPCQAYERITGVRLSAESAFESLRLLLNAGVAYEVRTTLHPELLTLADMRQLKDELVAAGVANYVVQRYRPHDARSKAPAVELNQAMLLELQREFATFTVR